GLGLPGHAPARPQRRGGGGGDAHAHRRRHRRDHAARRAGQRRLSRPELVRHSGSCDDHPRDLGAVHRRGRPGGGGLRGAADRSDQVRPALRAGTHPGRPRVGRGLHRARRGGPPLRHRVPRLPDGPGRPGARPAADPDRRARGSARALTRRTEMPTVHLVRYTAAPPAAVWAELTDFGAHGRWMPLTRMRLDEGSPRLGWCFAGLTGVGPLRFSDPMVVTGWRPPSESGPHHVAELRLVKTGRLLGGWVRVTVEENDDGSRVVWHEELTIRLLPATPL